MRVLILATAGLTGLAQAQDEHVALFKSVSGDVKVARAGTTLVPVAGTHIMRSDVVTSGPKSTGGIVFVDGTLLTQDASSEIEITRYVFQPETSTYDFSIYLKKGATIYSSGKLGKLSPQSVSVNTPRASVGVRGTRFLVVAQ
ncbi:MAG TPA: FecR domain-containing protein [Burkholderiaceae bacterium]|nr:FecR domain-containing protein [Burkholderiaceae bacterium]